MVDSALMGRSAILILSLSVLAACGSTGLSDDGNYALPNYSETDSIRELTVLYTNDEHGWMQGREPGTGASNLLGLWQQQEGYTEDGPFLLLSGGDHWTGPAISTWFQGEGMVEVMNGMGYDGSAIGNHEFDFGLRNLRQRISQANYPYLAANISANETDRIVSELGILPSAIVDVNDLRIALIGLSTIYTPLTTNPVNVAELTFADYEPVLRETVSKLERTDLDMIFVIAHVCMASLEPLAEAVADLNISLMGGGHCNELVAQRIGDTVLLESNGHFRAYARARFHYDIAADQIIAVDYATVQNEAGVSDAGIAQIVSRWEAVTEAQLNNVLGFSALELPVEDRRLQHWVASSWLDADPSADIAINNEPGIRAPLPGGEITLADIVSLLPFENTIIAVQITGAEILQLASEGARPFIAGLTRTADGWLVDKTGRSLDMDNTYRVLVNSFMYTGGAGYGSLAEFDDAGYDTETHYRQPLVDWLRSHPSSVDRPIVFP